MPLGAAQSAVRVHRILKSLPRNGRRQAEFPALSKPLFLPGAVAFACLRHLRTDRDLPAFLLVFGNRHPHTQHAIFKLGLGLIHFGPLRYGDHPAETAITPLRPVEAAARLFVLLPPFAFNNDSLLGALHLDIVLCHSWELRVYFQISVALAYFDRRPPHLAHLTARGRIERVRKSPVHFLRDPPHQPEWTKTRIRAKTEVISPWGVVRTARHAPLGCRRGLRRFCFRH